MREGSCASALRGPLLRNRVDLVLEDEPGRHRPECDRHDDPGNGKPCGDPRRCAAALDSENNEARWDVRRNEETLDQPWLIERCGHLRGLAEQDSIKLSQERAEARILRQWGRLESACTCGLESDWTYGFGCEGLEDLCRTSSVLCVWHRSHTIQT